MALICPLRYCWISFDLKHYYCKIDSLNRIALMIGIYY
jgi:hypothetical protein